MAVEKFLQVIIFGEDRYGDTRTLVHNALNVVKFQLPTSGQTLEDSYGRAAKSFRKKTTFR